MGAETFTNIVDDETDVNKAFNKAVEQANYDYGHSGYTGLIAEKGDYVIIKPIIEAVSAEDAVTLADELIDNGDQRIDDKWGPAGAIAITEKGNETNHSGWLFVGWASA